MVQMQISLTNVKANKLLMSMQYSLNTGTTFYPTEKTQSLVAKKKDISENQGVKNFGSDDQAPPHSSMFKKTFDRSRSSLGLHPLTSDHNLSELKIQDHNNEPSSSKLVPKVVPLAVKTATSQQCHNNTPFITPITSLWPFHKWGIDIAGPFPVAAGGLKFLIVAIDYFTKWIEAKAVAIITGNQFEESQLDSGDFVYRANDAQSTRKTQESRTKVGKEPTRLRKPLEKGGIQACVNHG
ncbi:reverse transcriptase domain-containing protein [Tanacetum coccineum]